MPRLLVALLPRMPSLPLRMHTVCMARHPLPLPLPGEHTAHIVSPDLQVCDSRRGWDPPPRSWGEQDDARWVEFMPGCFLPCLAGEGQSREGAGQSSRPEVPSSPSTPPLPRFLPAPSPRPLHLPCTAPKEGPLPLLVVRNDSFFRHERRWRGAGVAVPVFSLRTEASVGCGDFADLCPLLDFCRNTGIPVGV